MKYSAAFLLISLFFCTSCKKRMPCFPKEYQFSDGFKAISPDSDSFKIGDTIWVDYECPKWQTDFLSNKQIHFTNGILGMYAQILAYNESYDSVYKYAPAIDSFELKPIIGTFNPNVHPSVKNKQSAYDFSEFDMVYKLHLAIIPRKKGIYFLSATSTSGGRQKNNRCVKADFAFPYKNTNQHFGLYQSLFPDRVIDGMTATDMFCFRVVQ